MDILSGTSHTFKSVTTDLERKNMTDIDHYPIGGMSDGREMIFVDQYFLCEYVAIPKNFEVESILKMRERLGIFSIEGVDRKNLDLIAFSVRETPVFQMLNNPRMKITTCLYFLHLLEKTGLIAEDITNPFRQNYTRILESLHDGDYLFLRGQETKNLNIIVFNLDQMQRKQVGKQAFKNCMEMEASINKVNSLPSLD